MSVAGYTSHLQFQVLPALHATREAIKRADADIADYEEVAHKLANINEDSGPRNTMTELGSGVWVDVEIPSTAIVTLDIGLNIHLPLSPSEAREYSLKRAEMLKKRRKTLVSREERIQWEVEQFEGAIKEVAARNTSSV